MLSVSPPTALALPFKKGLRHVPPGSSTVRLHHSLGGWKGHDCFLHFSDMLVALTPNGGCRGTDNFGVGANSRESTMRYFSAAAIVAAYL